MQRRMQVQVLVSGEPQRAGFRAALQREAQRWGIVGWVRNLEDGAVQAVFQSSESNVNAMVGWCRGGPLREFVQEVTVKRQPLEAFSVFDVRQ